MRYRSELKFILSCQTAEMLKRRICAVMTPDENGSVYTVNNIYLDDQYDTFYNEKQAGAFSRDKYRIRYYNNELKYICLENKHKDGELAYKDKVTMTQEEFETVKTGDFSVASRLKHPLWQKVTAIHNARRLRPAAAFSYIREAYTYKPGDVRITFDSTIRPMKLIPMANSDAPLGHDPLLEVKFTGFMPSVIADMLHGLPLVRTELSKYCHIRKYCSL